MTSRTCFTPDVRMIKRNPGMEHGPIACMLGEHDQGRNLIKTAETALANGDCDVFKADTAKFIDLLRAHIDKENTILYRMADDIDRQTQDGDSAMLPAFLEINKNLEEIPKKFNLSV